MKTVKKVLLCVLLLLVIGVIGVCWWQWDNLVAIKTSLSHSRENLGEMMADNDQKITEAAQKVDGVTVRDLTEEEKQALRRGELDREELLGLLTAEKTGDTDNAPPTGDPGQEPAQEAPAAPAEPVQEQEETDQDKLSRYLAEIYVMKAEYTAWLEDKYNEAIEEYTALEESERTTAAKYDIGMRCMREALAKEDECDVLMAEMEQKILDLLTEMGEDTSLVDDIKAAYEEEKALKKAYYLGLHN